MITTALVGCAHIHTPGFVKSLQKRANVVKVKRVWDHDPARATQRAHELGAQVVSDVGDIWRDGDISAAVVCSETDRHEKLVLAGAEAGKHLFVEKPLGMGRRDAVAMAEAITSKGLIFQTGYFNRSWPPVLYLREHVMKGTFGKITRARASVCHNGAMRGLFDDEWRWMADVKQAGVGAFGDLATHGLDVLLWLLGDVESVAGTLDVGTARYPDCDETGEAILRFKNGVIATLAGAWDDVANPLQFVISGTEAHASVINDQVWMTCPKLQLEGKSPLPAEQLPNGYPHAFDLFLDAIEGKQGLPLVSAREAAYRVTVMETIYEAARKKQWQRCPAS